MLLRAESLRDPAFGTEFAVPGSGMVVPRMRDGVNKFCRSEAIMTMDRHRSIFLNDARHGRFRRCSVDPKAFLAEICDW
jgi:hypothetical protein